MLICRSACTNCRFLELHLWRKTVPAFNYMQHTYMEGTQRLHDQGLVVLLHVSSWWHLPFIGWYIYLAQLVYLLEFVLLPLLANSRLDWLIRALLGKLKVVWRTSVWEHLTACMAPRLWLTCCSFTFGSSNTSYRDGKFNLWTFFICRSFRL